LTDHIAQENSGTTDDQSGQRAREPVYHSAYYRAEDYGDGDTDARSTDGIAHKDQPSAPQEANEAAFQNIQQSLHLIRRQGSAGVPFMGSITMIDPRAGQYVTRHFECRQMLFGKTTELSVIFNN
jgi:hypothetical protein